MNRLKLIEKLEEWCCDDVSFELDEGRDDYPDLELIEGDIVFDNASQSIFLTFKKKSEGCDDV